MHKVHMGFLITRIFFFLIISFLISGCVSQQNQLGSNAYNQGNYDQAAGYWNPIAKNGDYAAQYNLGLLWEQGLGSTPKNKAYASQWFLLSAQQGCTPAMVRLARIQKGDGYNTAAISWFNLAARWGDTDAIAELQNWGKFVPSADLLAAQQYRDAISRQKAIDALGDAAYQLGRAIGGGGTRSSTGNVDQPTTSLYNYQPVSPPVNSLRTNNLGSKYKYKSSTGNRYKYDLSKPGDRMKYELDLGAQMKDKISMPVNPSVDIDRGLGHYGGGLQQ